MESDDAEHRRTLIDAIDFRDTQAWPDERIGRVLLAARIDAEAEARGIPSEVIPAEFAAACIARIQTQEAERV